MASSFCGFLLQAASGAAGRANVGLCSASSCFFALLDVGDGCPSSAGSKLRVNVID